MKMLRLMGWILMSIGVGLGLLALRDTWAQTATAVPMTAPQGSAVPAARVEQVPAPSAAASAASGTGTVQSGSGQGLQASPVLGTQAGAAQSAQTAPAPTPPSAAAAPVAPAASNAPPATPIPPPAAPKPPPKPPQSALTPESERITDQAIRGDMAFIRRYQERLKALNDRGDHPNSAYHYAKALHWVDFALDEYEMRNRSGIIEQALDQGAQLINALEAGRTDMPMQTGILPLSVKLRDDLWAEAQKLKQDAGGFKCSGGDVARLEVQLVWAGHIQKDLGWRSAKPHLQAAERYYRDAVAGAETCPRPVAAAPGAAPVAGPAAADLALAKLPPARQIEILADRVHFAYDRAVISVATAPVLDRVASLLRGNTSISLTIEGHADERGSAEYNVKLSQRRADAVRAYLMAAGVAAERLKTAALGKSKPEVKADSIDGHAQNRRVVFVPSAATDMQLQKQRQDLQLERARK